MTMNNAATTLVTEHELRTAGKPALGKICWFSVTALTVEHSFLERTLNDLGINSCPPRPADSDVWRRVTKAVNESRITAANGVVSKVLVRDVPQNDADKIVRRLVVETTNRDAGKGKELDYVDANGQVGAYDLVFVKSTGQFKTVKTSVVQNDMASDLVLDIKAAYQAERGMVNADGVRSMVTRTLKAANAITVRPTGGVMFVPRETTSVLDALQRVGEAVPQCSVHSLTLLDEPGQPGMIAEALTNETVNQADQLSTDLAKLISDGAISERRFTTALTDAQGLKRRLSAYRELLGDDLDGVKVRLDQLDRQMAQAAMQVESR